MGYILEEAAVYPLAPGLFVEATSYGRVELQHWTLLRFPAISELINEDAALRVCDAGGVARVIAPYVAVPGGTR